MRAWLPGRGPRPARGAGPVAVLGQLAALVVGLLVVSRLLGGGCVDAAPSCAVCARPVMHRPDAPHVGLLQARLATGADGRLELLGDDLPRPPTDDPGTRLVLLAPGSSVDAATLLAHGLSGVAAAGLTGLALAAGLPGAQPVDAVAGLVGACRGRCLRITATLLLPADAQAPRDDELLVFERWEDGAWRAGRRSR